MYVMRMIKHHNIILTLDGETIRRILQKGVMTHLVDKSQVPKSGEGPPLVGAMQPRLRKDGNTCVSRTQWRLCQIAILLRFKVGVSSPSFQRLGVLNEGRVLHKGVIVLGRCDLSSEAQRTAGNLWQLEN
jgi:hypothetical protein